MTFPEIHIFIYHDYIIQYALGTLISYTCTACDSIMLKGIFCIPNIIIYMWEFRLIGNFFH